MPAPRELLSQLSAAQGLTPTTHLDQIVEHLREPLGNYAEVEFRSDGRRIDLITLTRKPEQAEIFINLLSRLGATQDQLANVGELLRFGSGHTVGMKIPIAGTEAGGELYLRGAIPLPSVYAFIQENSIKPPHLDQVEIVAELFGKSYTHMLATEAAVESAFTLFFTTYLQSGNGDQEWVKLQKAMATLGIAGESIGRFKDTHRLLSATRPETLYFSMRLVDGQPQKVIKIDYSAVELTTLAQVMIGHGLTPAAKILLDSWGKILGVRRAGYAGIIFSDEGISAVRAYFSVGRGLFE